MWGFFSSRERIINKESAEAYRLMKEEIARRGGVLNFSVSIQPDGWLGECREIPSIIAGGSSSNPTEEEIMRALNDAVKAAFHIEADGDLDLKSTEFKTKEVQLCAPN